jgi:hypothetical protein
VIEFVLYVYLGTALYSKTQVFDDINRCKYFSERLSGQHSVPEKNGKSKKITAICLPRDKK